MTHPLVTQTLKELDTLDALLAQYHQYVTDARRLLNDANSDPDEVSAILLNVAQATARISNTPAPDALSKVLNTLYQNTAARQLQAQQQAQDAKKAAEQAKQAEAERVRSEFARIKAEAERQAAYEAETEFWKTRLGIA